MPRVNIDKLSQSLLTANAHSVNQGQFPLGKTYQTHFLAKIFNHQVVVQVNSPLPPPRSTRKVYNGPRVVKFISAKRNFFVKDNFCEQKQDKEYNGPRGILLNKK